MKTLVMYQSKYGCAAQYAAWIAEALHAKVMKAEEANAETLAAQDVIVYVGALYAGRVMGFKQFAKQLAHLTGKRIALCMVGMMDPSETEKYRHIFENNVPEAFRGAVKPFALQGDQIFSKLSFIHRVMMNFPKAMAEKVPEAERTPGDKEFLANFGKDVRYAKRENIEEVVAYCKI